jgi:Holliday junction resolvase
MSYVKGRRFENYVRKKLEKAGYIVARSAGSKGPFDLVALRKGEILLIQCKWRKSRVDNRLLEAASKAGGKAIVATHVKGRVTLLEAAGGELNLKT